MADRDFTHVDGLVMQATNCMHVSQHFQPLVACPECIKAAILAAAAEARSEERKALREWATKQASRHRDQDDLLDWLAAREEPPVATAVDREMVWREKYDALIAALKADSEKKEQPRRCECCCPHCKRLW